MPCTCLPEPAVQQDWKQFLACIAGALGGHLLGWSCNMTSVAGMQEAGLPKPGVPRWHFLNPSSGVAYAWCSTCGQHCSNFRPDQAACSAFMHAHELWCDSLCTACLAHPLTDSKTSCWLRCCWQSCDKPQLCSPLQDDKVFKGVTAGCCAGPVRDDEHFIVWMRTAALPSFRKLWGRIDQDLPAHTQVSIQQTNRELNDDDQLLCWAMLHAGYLVL